MTSEIIASRNKQAVGWWRRRRWLLLPGYGTGGGGGGGGGGVRSIPVEMIRPRGRGGICRARPCIRGYFGGFGNARGWGGASRTGRDDHRTRGGGIAEPWWVDRRLRGTLTAGRLGRRTTAAPRPRTRVARTTSAASIAAIIPPHRLPDGPPPLVQTAETFDVMLDGPKIGLPRLDHLVHRGRR